MEVEEEIPEARGKPEVNAPGFLIRRSIAQSRAISPALPLIVTAPAA